MNHPSMLAGIITGMYITCIANLKPNTMLVKWWRCAQNMPERGIEDTTMRHNQIAASSPADDHLHRSPHDIGLQEPEGPRTNPFPTPLWHEEMISDQTFACLVEPHIMLQKTRLQVALFPVAPEG